MHPIAVDGTYNARGIGDPDRPWLVRSAAVDELSAQGEHTLRGLGVTLVLDLRERDERAPHTHGLPVHSQPLYGTAPPASGSLEEVYATLVDERGAELARAVAVIAEHDDAVLVHCAAGKDRTGLVVALCRLVAGDSRAEILADYALSERTVAPARGALVEAQLDREGLTGSARAEARRLHLLSPESALDEALDRVASHGGAAAYLRANGLPAAALARLETRAAR
ncbi:tyrosine-protein phosphatase [Leucobacter sp. M11]|uniref:tyrosine-protein phosphatase n=1 Tax=Leucobacter sp. M11 TaxID=2993565 RepID=UPI002D7E345D|nr:tyrosine-protein phosphatase [Leucobacter sp. M11]MEB4614407.1 tyrosine-protein phosphatase [Leucobacter sp. M11]